MVEWFAGENAESAAFRGARQHVAFRWNLFHHIGAKSTLRSSKSPLYPVCWELLGEPILFEVESYKPKLCPNDDMWPCDWGSPACSEHRPCPMGAAPMAKPPPVVSWGELAVRS